ncbi:MAG: hypothetical protein ABSC06_39815 [Rhodopila sp.]
MTQDLGRRTVRYWLDPYIGVKADDPAGYMALRNANTTAGAAEMFLTDGTLRFNGSTYAMDQRNGGVEHYLVRPLHGEQDRFLWWVAANRAERLTAEDRENLWSQDDIDTIKQTNQGQVPFDYRLDNGQITRSREAVYLDSLRKLDVFNKNVLDLAVQSGLLNGDRVSALFANPFYVPFYRVADEGGHFAGPNITSGFVKQKVAHDRRVLAQPRRQRRARYRGHERRRHRAVGTGTRLHGQGGKRKKHRLGDEQRSEAVFRGARPVAVHGDLGAGFQRLPQPGDERGDEVQDRADAGRDRGSAVHAAGQHPRRGTGDRHGADVLQHRQ